MSALDDLLAKISADIPTLVTKANASLATVGTSLPALEGAVKTMAKDAFSDPAASLPKIIVDGAEVAFAADPMVGLGISVAYALFSSGIMKPADVNDLVRERTDGNSMDRDV